MGLLTQGITFLSHKLNSNINKRDRLMKLFIETDIAQIFVNFSKQLQEFFSGILPFTIVLSKNDRS